MTMYDPTRRDVIAAAGAGVAARALPAGAVAGGGGGAPHHAPRARRVVQLFMAGAPSTLDLFDDTALPDTAGQRQDVVRQQAAELAIRMLKIPLGDDTRYED